MHLDIPATWDSALLQSLADKSRGHGITCSIYGAIPAAFPTGRPDDVAIVQQKRVEQHFGEAKRLGLGTNYLLNGFRGGRVLNEDNREILGLIQWVVQDLNPDFVTVSDPELANFMSVEYGWDRFIVSTIGAIKSLYDLKRWMKCAGVKTNIVSVVLHHDAARGHHCELLKIVEFARKNNIQITVMVTESCYHGCRVRQAHYGLVANPRRMDSGFDPYQASCILKRLREPSALLDLSGFLMPEELREIQSETGISSFKITGRSCSNEWISSVTEHYMKGHSPINLYDMIVFTAPLLKERLNMDVSGLFFLDSPSYLTIGRYLKSLEPGSRDWTDYLNRQAVDLFDSGCLVISDPGGEYTTEDGRVIQKKAGAYASMLTDHLYQYRPLLRTKSSG